MGSVYVEYPLQNGFVHNWLAAGPQAIAIDRSRLSGLDFKRQSYERHTSAQSGITARPVERGPLDAGLFTLGKYTGSWMYYPCLEDHAVDHSGYYHSSHYLRSWAYVEVVNQRQQRVQVALTSSGPTDLWVANMHLVQANPRQEGSATTNFTLQFSQGVTPILVRFANIGSGHILHAMSLRFCQVEGVAKGGAGEKWIAAEGLHVRFRTLMPNVERRNAFEKLSADAYVERDVYEGDTPIVLRWPQEPRAQAFAHVRLQQEKRIYVDGDSAGAAGDSLRLGHALQFPAGAFQAVLMPNPNEVYIQHMRIFQHLPLWLMGKQRYHATPWGDLATRRNEALLAVATVEDSPFAQMARMAWAAWTDVDGKALLGVIERIHRYEEGSNLLLLALLGMLYRWGDHASFPQEIRQPLESCIIGYRYWLDAAGHDLMDFTSASNRILFHICEILAGQLYGDRLFADQQSGAWHRARGERLAMEWITSYGAVGSPAWNSPDAMEQEFVALLHLCDLAETDQVFELATVALDKLFFTLALNSFHGVLGVAGQRGCASFVKSGLLQPTAAISNLMWGMGIFNHHIAGVVSLACSTNYQMPTLIQSIALDAPAELWSREQHAPLNGQAANVVTYKTPDYMLSSLQDYQPGQPGEQETVWRATLGVEAIIFATHPGSSSESDSRYPGYWSGNALLPRVAQWKDVLVAIHQLDGDDLFGFTHAYFPTATFDEYVLRDGWGFARRGDGYVALTNSQGFTMTQQGRYAKRELRAQGASQSWLVQMGRAEVDGDFANFQTKVLALPLRYADGTVDFTTLRGDTLHFGWQGPLLVNSEMQPLDGFAHYENLYTTSNLSSGEMVIQTADDGLRLDFSVS